MSTTTQVFYRRLGSSGLRVSVPIFGAMSLGSKQWSSWVTEGDEALDVLKGSIGIAGLTHSTPRIRAIDWTIHKEVQLFLATKCSSSPNVGSSHFRIISAPMLLPSILLTTERDNCQPGWPLPRCLSSTKSKRHFNVLGLVTSICIKFTGSTRTLQLKETMKALHDLVQMGKVRYIGASSMRVWQFALMNEVAEKHGWTKFSSMQDEYSLLYREEEREMIPYCKHHGIGIIPYSPLAGGALARPLTAPTTTRHELVQKMPIARKFTAAVETIINRVEELSKKKGWTMSQVALAWVEAKIDAPLVGLGTVKRVEESILEKGKFELSDEEMKYLEEPYEPVNMRGGI
ncbi:Aldo/keto reductase [Flagelloscypha sp. PMI_526]|nr:Aldo/keto reductase [Flagelloscypha sp. PMI_526]